MLTPDQLIKGQTVTREDTPGTIGLLTGRVSNMGPITMIEVDWGGHREKHDIEALVIHADDEDDDIRSLIARGAFGSIEDFQRRITYEKLQGTLTDLFYSMSVAEMDFYPHQFKPVLRFVDAPNSRLLIADEVGLGKTIEAGLIWTECRARFQSRRLLVVCPPMLCGKWVQELRDRFQLQDVREVKTGDLAKLLDSFERVGDQLSFHAVCSYRSLLPSRSDKDLLRPLAFEYTHQDIIDRNDLSPRGQLLSRIADQDETTSFADLVVFDEAHVMKNTATATHMAGRIISAASQAVVSLSATPIHNKSRDLFALLQMVNPDFFNDEGVFRFFCEANRPLVGLLNLLGRHDTTRAQVTALMTALDQTHFLRGSESFRRAMQTAAAFEPTSACRIDLSAQLEKLNIFDAYINRTRKTQIDKSGRVQRTAVKLPVKLLGKEMELYKAILTYLRRRAIFNNGEVSIFHLMNPALRMTSCLPVMAKLLREGRWGDEEEIREIEEAFGDAPEDDNDSGDVLPTEESSITKLLDDDFETSDSKFLVFRDHLVNNLGGEKVIVFAFFKDTVEYLSRRLTFDGLKCQVLTGNITDMEERRQILDDFENRQEIQVLLCSEIAAEGIDLQFCRTIVNYDLPWNPMRVEQRIGRIDRIGQTAKSINIINFCVEDTIDGRIYNHLYNKLNIFQQTIGDLEEIIGQQVTNLARSLLADILTPEQEKRRIEAAADAIILERREVQKLEASSEGLVAYRDYLAENIGNSQRLGRYVKPDELKLYMDDFFARKYRGSRLEWDHPVPGCGRISLSYEAAADMQQFCNRNHLAMPLELCSQRGNLIFTLYPDILKQYRRKHRNLALVNHMHPLVRWITSGLKAAPDVLYPVSRLSLVSDAIEPGWYIYLIQRLTLDGLHKREKLIYGLASAATGHILTTGLAEELLNDALDRGEKHFSQPEDDLTFVFDALLENMNDVCGLLIGDFKSEMDAKRRIEISRSEASHKRKIDSAHKTLDTIMNNPRPQESVIRMTKGRIATQENLFARKMKELERAAQIKTAHADVAGGVLEVKAK